MLIQCPIKTSELEERAGTDNGNGPPPASFVVSWRPKPLAHGGFSSFPPTRTASLVPVLIYLYWGLGFGHLGSGALET